ncbi:MAG TPA: isochorismatase family protein [Burkholderiales bacterium]
MSSERLDAVHCCLLLFDFLVGHVDRHRARYAPVLANAARVLAAARAAGAMVAYARADHRADGGTTARTLHDSGPRPPLITGGTPEAEIVPELAPRPGEYLVPKHRWSAFHGTYLDLALRSRHASTIVLCGGSTEIGISSTAYAARDLDYDLVIASDACTSAKHEVHEQLMREVFPRLARVRTTMQILEMLEP